jgi:cardiolipin synthase A/B
MTQFAVHVEWTTVLSALITLYALSVALFLIMENRSPQSTFAWLFILFALPGIGVVLYIMFGRGWHAFSRERALTTVREGTALAERSRKTIEAQPARLAELDREPMTEYAQLGKMLWAAGHSPLTLSNRFEILQDASEKYPRLLSDTQAASVSIHMVYYEWSADAFTEKLGQLLIEKARSSVEVRILYDPFGSFAMLNRRYMRWLRAAGIQIHPFSPLYRIHTLSYRNHRKIAVFDGRVAYCGGMNMTEKHLTGPKGFTGWRDTHSRVMGEAALVLQTVFATMWLNLTGENLFTDRHFPELPADLPTLPIQVISAGPDSQWQTIRKSYLAMIALARRHVYIQSPFLILDESLAEGLKSVALAGLDVRLMIAPRGAEPSPAYRAGMTYAVDMASAGVKVFLYQGAYFHPKTVCVDSTLCSIGSANMDIRSFSIDYETNLVIYDQQVTRELETDFEKDLEHCELLSASEYESRRRLTRLADSLMRLCSPLL